MKCLVGIDDTDSSSGFCTTYLAFRVASQSADSSFRVFGYPRLVRLNPNVPFKTRGNAAVCVEFEVNSDDLLDDAFEAAQRLLEAEADVANGANSALIMESKEASDDLDFFRRVYRRAINGVVGYKGVIGALSKMGTRRRLMGNGMGAVGAAA